MRSPNPLTSEYYIISLKTHISHVEEISVEHIGLLNEIIEATTILLEFKNLKVNEDLRIGFLNSPLQSEHIQKIIRKLGKRH